MNPRHLFALTADQKERYMDQPDRFYPLDRVSESEEYEVPDLIEKAGLRLWYNTQTDCYQKHWHDAQEIVVPLEGPYTVTVQGREYVLEPGDVLLIPPGALHALTAPPYGSRFIFLVDLTPFYHHTSFLQVQSILAQPILISAVSCPEIYEHVISLFMEIAVLYWGSRPARQLSICARIFDIYASYTNCVAGADRDEMPHETLGLAQKFDRLLDYLQKNYAKDISLGEAAQRLGVSKYYFTRVFRRHTGRTFNDHMTYLRIQAAEELLKNGRASVADVCAACGYESVSSFNRNFRKLKGCSPTEFRKLHQTTRLL